MDLPKFIYKYSPISVNLIRLLATRSFYLAAPNALNDPFEIDFEIEKISSLPSKKIQKSLCRTLNIIPNDISPDILCNSLKTYLHEEMNSKYGITCFSENHEDVRMWSYYAMGHRGVCLRFETEKLLQSRLLRDFDLKLERVKSINSIPIVRPIFHEDKISFENGEDIGINKMHQWTEEKEIRLHGWVGNNPYRSVPFGENVLTGIILGEKISNQDKDLLVFMMKHNKLYDRLDWFRATKNYEQSTIKIEGCDFLWLKTLK